MLVLAFEPLASSVPGLLFPAVASLINDADSMITECSGSKIFLDSAAEE